METNKLRIGLLASQIGYDCNDPKRILLRSESYLSESLSYTIHSWPHLKEVYSGLLKYWGEPWGSYWWVLDFSELDEEGDYLVTVNGDNVVLRESIRIAKNCLWESTFSHVAISQFEKREELVPFQKPGWKDCGSKFKELSSHCLTILGMLDILITGFEKYLSRDEQLRLQSQIANGCDYILHCQQLASQRRMPDGVFVHDIPGDSNTIDSENALATATLAYSGRVFSAIDFKRSSLYLKASEKTIAYWKSGERYGMKENFHATSYGFEENAPIPNSDKTHDLFMILWATVELCKAGLNYRDDVVEIANSIINRQVSKDQNIKGFYGNFYTYEGYQKTERANTHHHVGYDTGIVIPHFIAPFVDMLRMWPKHKDAIKWKKLIDDFVEGYFIPACQTNPFFLLPMAIDEDTGVLQFLSTWHGINATYGFTAALAAKLEGFLGKKELRMIAVGNLQWIAGLNSGIYPSMLVGCVTWTTDSDLNDDRYTAFSQIVGIGKRSVGCWSGIKGSIVNGICAMKQFHLPEQIDPKDDLPAYFGDEDWIPHAGGWLSGLAHLREIKFYSKY